MGVGAQEQLAAALLGLQAGEQVRRGDVGAAQRAVEAPIEILALAADALVAEVLRVQARLGRHYRQQQQHIALRQLVAHALDQRQVVALVLSAIGHRLELFIRVQPVVLADHHAGAAFVEQQVVQRGPDVGAELLDRELLVVMALEGLRQVAVEHAELVGSLVTQDPAQGPEQQQGQHAEEQGDVECA
ncbi:hypothetical protein D3C85_1002480 [compost metagenome]